MAKNSTKSNKASENEFKLPRYLKLAKGAMWLDIEGENASGVKLYNGGPKLVGRGKMNEVIEGGKIVPLSDQPEVPNDKYHNNNFANYGYVEEEPQNWYVYSSTISYEKQSRLILAYKHKILVEADPKK